MLVRRICAALTTTGLTLAGVVALAVPSEAAGTSCSTATPLTAAAADTVGPGNTNDYWSFDAVAGTYEFTVDSGTASTNLYVDNSNCTTVLCVGDEPGSDFTVETCTVTVTTPQTLKIRIANFSATTDAYVLSVAWKTLPRLGTQCSDGVDNDGDGQTDTGDLGCSGPLDTLEGDQEPCPSIAGVATCLSLTAGDEITRVNVIGPDLADDVTIAGSIDLYTFGLPGGGSANIPCVVLTGVTNPCASFGGTYFGRIYALVPVTVPLADPFGGVIATVGICEAKLTAMVAGAGVRDVNAVTVC